MKCEVWSHLTHKRQGMYQQLYSSSGRHVLTFRNRRGTKILYTSDFFSEIEPSPWVIPRRLVKVYPVSVFPRLVSVMSSMSLFKRALRTLQHESRGRTPQRFNRWFKWLAPGLLVKRWLLQRLIPVHMGVRRKKSKGGPKNICIYNMRSILKQSQLWVSQIFSVL